VVVYVSGHKTDDDDDNDDEVLVLSSPGIYPDPQGGYKPPPLLFMQQPLTCIQQRGRLLGGLDCISL